MLGRASRKAAIVVVGLAIVPRCTCGDSTPDCTKVAAPHATFSLAPGCLGEYCAMQCDPGFADCDYNHENGCETPTAAVNHQIVETYFGQCTTVCELGWSDCDHDTQNGCETQASACPKPDGGALAPIATLGDTPRGLVACGGFEFYFDGTALRSIDSKSLANRLEMQSNGVPTGGLACDGSYVYWTTLSDSSSTPTGALWRFKIGVGATAATPLVIGVDPGRGIDLGPASAYWIARTGWSDAGSMLAQSWLGDGSTAAVMPAVESDAYKVFALAQDGDYALADGALYRNPRDGGVASVWIDDAGASSALLAANGQPFAVVHTANATGLDASDDASDSGEDGGDASASPGDFFAAVTADAGLVTVLSTAVKPLVATTSNTSAIIAASDDTIYLVHLPAGGVTVLATNQLHVVDVAVDGPYAYWTTRGTISTPGAVWRIQIP